MKFLLHHLLQQSAQIHPDRPAVIYDKKAISYRQLDEITNKLAFALLEYGIKKGDRVGIYMNKSIASLISIYGILKAGVVYVPLDPKAPTSRLSYIINNCTIECLLTSSQQIEKIGRILSEQTTLKQLIFTDNSIRMKDVHDLTITPWEKINKIDNSVNIENSSIETDLAYILYTSGSTGVPKGVMISHLNALTFINWVQATFKFKPEDRLSNHAPFHFDLSILDVFGAAYIGAAVVIVPDTLSTFPLKLADWIEENQISIWYSVPSILTMMLLHGELNNHQFSNLHTIHFAGEVFPTKYLRDLMKVIPHANYYNLYGPTETNVITYYKVEKIPPNHTQPIPIGKACTNMHVFALSKDGKLITKPGEEGELYARGSCVAQGYWDDKEKTNKNFIHNPLNKNFEEKIYCTGDIVSIDHDGNYIYKGRRDHMIKSRGYRIELGEIETVIYSHPQAKEVAVVAVPDQLIGHRIQSYIVLHEKEKISAQDLRIFCSKKLPPYMIPELFEFKDYLPKTSTGKINKVALTK